MLLGRKSHTAGNRTRYTVDYSNWLLEGESISSATVVLGAEFTATVTDITIDVPTINSSTELVFYLEGGSVDEVFTLDVQVVSSRDERKTDTCEFFVIAP